LWLFALLLPLFVGVYGVGWVADCFALVAVGLLYGGC